ncbi:MAG TPA: VCBS repeat-containing protein, partial [Polyangiaceae bacterium]|nr:VCBS repeat-containing protein [Polyangiaceae bacterium]
PVSADVDGDGRAEIYLQSRNGVLSRLDGAGKVTASLSIGTESWVTPAFVDADQDGTVEIIASSTSGVKILKGAALALLDELPNFAQGLQTGPVVADVERDGKAEFFMGSWYGTDLLRVQLKSRSWSRWDSLGGTSKHQGQHPVTTYQDVSQPAVRLSQLDAEVTQVAQTLSGSDGKKAERAADDVENGLLLLSSGQPQEALGAFRSAEQNLRGVAALSTQNAQLSQIALDAAKQSLARLTALYGSTNKQVQSAAAALVDADDLFGSGDFKKTLSTVQKAYSQMDRAAGTIANHCLELQINEPYLALQCEFLVSVLRIPASSSLARETALSGLQSMVFLDIAQAGASLERAIGLLPSSSAEVRNLTSTLRKLARLYLDDRKIATSSQVTSAEAAYQAGLSALTAGNFTAAAQQFSAAVTLSAK